ncbi:hypothetical protein HanRHA438_Chr04g0187031 [Helianthus annuus]|uniref:Uncharacterized protein n=1 Tax=Helianthus annuus TaxID=4232 RepID=A0A251S4R3_HELAN|nr:UPF0481 protein At3g47200 [Helianthus annuus]KAF5811092.1 hypothetical protein HanXRQr2_Chr04g0177431 [Helianthus annuus]KAJ0581804.1 hypothetical protein HanHA300_Chr04g0145291 [Helianthus annuus]KAJ0597772.1 hypothetical protein HanHA89_Chr04g0158451 [Helianthus annuus]KAJ0758418.1 hypothetical protein HanLR1_Chr04g0150191 [Helianthus annuus]KAJ0762073.1 hypothetical protein HanOQP8_Chr04g0157321 [Helianthus annuus]
MQVQDQTHSNIELPDDSIIDSIIDSISNSVVYDAPTPPPSSVSRIPRIPRMVREKDDYEKYYVPNVVSIGPYHFGEPKLQFVEKLKPVYTMKLLKGKKDILKSLYKTLGEQQMVEKLRSFYEENSTTKFSDDVFTKMMLLDSCFILHYVNSEKWWWGYHFPQLNYKQLSFVCQDLFMLENQIPFQVLSVVMSSLAKIYDLKYVDTEKNIHQLIRSASLLAYPSDQHLLSPEPDHLLHLLHRSHTPQVVRRPTKNLNRSYNYKSSNFPNVNQLLDVWIRFKPCETLEHINFSRRGCMFSSYVELPPITVDDDTKPILLNLIAYETCPGKEIAWVSSYVCLLQSLICNHEDVKVLIKAGVLENGLGTNNEVVDFFKEITNDLVTQKLYIEVKNEIQSHYEGWSNTPISELTHEYRKSPWKFLSLLGALIALFLSAVQTYFTVWSPK